MKNYKVLQTLFTVKFLLLILVLCIAPIGFVQVKDYLNQQHEAEVKQSEKLLKQRIRDTLATSKDWEVLKYEEKHTKEVSVKTKYKDSTVSYIVEVKKTTGFTSPLPYHIMYSLSFSDKDGFLIESISLFDNSHVNTLIDDFGIPYGMEWQGTFALSEEKYHQINQLSVQWWF